MEFPGLSKNSMWNFQELIKNKVEFPWVTKKKKRISRGLGFLPLWNFQGTYLSQFCRISRGGALFCLEFPGLK